MSAFLSQLVETIGRAGRGRHSFSSPALRPDAPVSDTATGAWLFGHESIDIGRARLLSPLPRRPGTDLSAAKQRSTSDYGRPCKEKQ